jgi:chaperonin GroES
MHDWAVLVPGTADERTAGGLFIPDSAKEKPKEGIVEAIGPGAYEEEKRGKKEDRKERKFIPSVVKPGDRVLYESWAGQNVKIGTEERVLVRERNILGLIDRPLQIPAQTGGASKTAITEYVSSLPAEKSSQDRLLRTPVKARKAKPAKKGSKKKAAKKPSAKKAAKKRLAKAAKPRKGRVLKTKKSGKKK